jgi:fermentation-respiration switch protein FrsA (DUF1100 family)
MLNNAPSTSRSPQSKWIWKRSLVYRILIISILAFLILSLLGSVGISAYVGWSLTHPERMPIDDSPSNYGLTYEDVVFKSKGGDVDLSGWWLDTKQNGVTPVGKTIIFAHGYSHNRLYKRIPTLSLTQLLIDKGYDTLLFDFRNSGVSGGDITSVGQLEKFDLLGAIDFVKSIRPNSEIILFGFSMGASTSLIAAAESPDVTAVIADSPFDDLTTYLEANLSVWSDLPNFPFTPMMMTIIPLITGLDPKEVSPISTIHQFGKRPILFIHGDADHSIPMGNSERILAASHNPNAELWIVHGADHVFARKVNPEAYDRKILEFLAKIN